MAQEVSWNIAAADPVEEEAGLDSLLYCEGTRGVKVAAIERTVQGRFVQSDFVLLYRKGYCSGMIVV